MLSDYLTGETLIAYIQNMVCKLYKMQIAVLKKISVYLTAVLPLHFIQPTYSTKRTT